MIIRTISRFFQGWGRDLPHGCTASPFVLKPGLTQFRNHVIILWRVWYGGHSAASGGVTINNKSYNEWSGSHRNVSFPVLVRLNRRTTCQPGAAWGAMAWQTPNLPLHLPEQHDHGRRTHSSVVWIAYRQMSTTAGEGDKDGSRRWPHTGALSYRPASRRQSRKIKTCTKGHLFELFTGWITQTASWKSSEEDNDSSTPELRCANGTEPTRTLWTETRRRLNIIEYQSVWHWWWG